MTATAAEAGPPTISSAFAGYQGPVGAGGSAFFTVPKTSCVAATQFVGATVYVNRTGTRYYMGAEIVLRCIGHQVHYAAAVFGHGSGGGCPTVSHTMAVSPGDKVFMRVTDGSPATAIVKDITKGTTLPLTTCGVGGDHVWIGMCVPGPDAGGPVPGSLPDWCDASGLGVVPPASVPEFGVVKFHNVDVDAAALPAASPVYFMQNAGPLKISTGPLSASGKAFKTPWHHA
jgi:hypothetical protein